MNTTRARRGQHDDADLRDSVNSLSAADRATTTIQLANLVEKQSKILGEPIPDLALRFLHGDKSALRPSE